MTTRPTDDDLAQWKRLAEEATPGPWDAEYGEDDGELTVSAGTARTLDGTTPGSYVSTDRILEWDDVWPEDGGDRRVSDAEFIAASRAAFPALIAEVEALRAERDAALARIEKVRGVLDSTYTPFDPGNFCAEDVIEDVRRALDGGEEET